jgi:hypothetical protein
LNFESIHGNKFSLASWWSTKQVEPQKGHREADQLTLSAKIMKELHPLEFTASSGIWINHPQNLVAQEEILQCWTIIFKDWA